MKTSSASAVAALLALSTALVSLAGAVEAAPPSGWTAPFQIDHFATYSNGPNNVHVATADDGSALAAWDWYSTDTGSTVIVWSMYSPGTGWSSPVVVQGSWGDASDPAVAAWANGSYEMVYRDTFLGTYS